MRRRCKAEHVSGAENGAKRAENRVERSIGWSGHGVAKKRWSGNGAGSEVTDIGWSEKRLFTAQAELTWLVQSQARG